MSLQSLTDLTASGTGYTYTLNGVYTFASTPYILLYSYYLGQFLYEAIYGDEAAIEDFITQKYNTLKTYTSPTDLESSFVADYEHFVQN